MRRLFSIKLCGFRGETRTCSDDKRWRADGENHLSLIREATFVIMQGPAMLEITAGSV